MSTLQLVYVSDANPDLSGEEIIEILKVSQEKNHAKQISGLLLYQDSHFMQLIEGEEATVLALFEKIAEDKRHRNVVVVGRFAADKPSMPTWAMAYFSPENTEDSARKHHFAMSRQDILELCESFPIDIGALFWEAINGIYPTSVDHPPH